MGKAPDKGTRLRVTERVIAYGPVVLTVAILLLQTFLPTALNALPLTATSAILAGSVIFLVWHVETMLLESNQSLRTLQLRIEKLESTQVGFLNSTTSLSQVPLGSAFSTIAAEKPRVDHLRIYAISSQQIISFMKFNPIKIDKCHILLRAFEPDDAAHRDFLNQIRLVVADWHRMQKSGRITELEIRHYDFFPTEYECIFDDAHLVLGLYDSDPDDYSEVRVRDPILIRGTTDAGRIMISEFAERFDNLFKTCASHHGPPTLDYPGEETSKTGHDDDED